MRRSILLVLLCGCGVGSNQGCSHMLESRAIQAFADSLQKENLEGLRKHSSDGFESKALQNDAAIDAFKLVGVPSGKTKVVKVVGKGDEKKVTAEVGDAKRKILFKLQRDPDTKKLVVDDIFLNPKPAPSNKPVSVQMGVLQSAHEFVKAWKSGEREAVLGTATPEFAQLLGELPPDHLSKLTRRLAGEIREPKTHDISEETAELHYSTLAGHLTVQFRKVNDQWKVDDAGLLGRREGDTVASVRHMAVITSAALAFEAAYNASDKRTLERVCTKKFFDGSLAPANLSLIKLPAGTDIRELDEVKIDGQTATFITSDKDDVIKISLVRQPKAEAAAPPEYRVEEVTIYEGNGTQDKRLSALFTAHAVMQLFSEYLLARDVQQLKLNSTPDFNQRVWNRVKEGMLPQLPMTEIHAGQPEVLNTVFQGPITQMTVNQGSGPLTYVLRDQGGCVFVDDVLMPAPDRPESLKTTLELMIPILDFCAGYQSASMDVLRGNASRELCRTVWNQVDRMPDIAQDPIPFLRAPLHKMTLTPDRGLAILGDERFGAKVYLVKERDRYVLDDVLLVAGPEAAQRQSLKRLLRERLQRGRFAGAPDRGDVSQAPTTEAAAVR